MISLARQGECWPGKIRDSPAGCRASQSGSALLGRGKSLLSLSPPWRQGFLVQHRQAPLRGEAALLTVNKGWRQLLGAG